MRVVQQSLFSLFHIFYLFICPLRLEKRVIILQVDFSNTEETLFLSLFYSRDFTFILHLYIYLFIYLFFTIEA